MTSLIREFSIGYSSYVLCTECDEQWIDTDYVWVGAPRNNRCTDCFSFEEEYDSMGDSS
mgnify:CR=1 FL=1|jgi:hypothetical protein